MGVKLAPLIEPETHDLSVLENHRLAIDGSYVIIAGLRKIRPRGVLFTNKWGEPLAPIHAVFYKTLRLMEEGIGPVYVFDGIPPQEKRIRDEMRLVQLQQLWRAYERAREKGNAQLVRNLFQNPALVYKKALVDVMEILRTMGVPAMIAPSEGEAQGSYLVKASHAKALLSPDYDSLLFGCPTVVQRLDLVKKQVDVIHLEDLLRHLGVSYPQLVDMGILIGTDYHHGVKGIGPKRAHKLLQKYDRIESIPGIPQPEDLTQLRSLFLTSVVTPYNPLFLPPNAEMCSSLLARKGFGPKRVEKARLRLERAFRRGSTTQQTLSFS